MTKDYWKKMTHSLNRNPALFGMQHMVYNRQTYRKDTTVESSNQLLSYTTYSLTPSTLVSKPSTISPRTAIGIPTFKQQ